MPWRKQKLSTACYAEAHLPNAWHTWPCVTFVITPYLFTVQFPLLDETAALLM